LVSSAIGSCISAVEGVSVDMFGDSWQFPFARATFIWEVFFLPNIQFRTSDEKLFENNPEE
jgi:hypothetical protein